MSLFNNLTFKQIKVWFVKALVQYIKKLNPLEKLISKFVLHPYNIISDYPI